MEIKIKAINLNGTTELLVIDPTYHNFSIEHLDYNTTLIKYKCLNSVGEVMVKTDSIELIK